MKQNVRVGLSIHVIVVEVVKIQWIGAVKTEQTGGITNAFCVNDVTLRYYPQLEKESDSIVDALNECKTRERPINS